jgi:branched-chain amino acid aminotransferase
MLETLSLKNPTESNSASLQITRKVASTLKPLPPVDQLLFGRHFSDHWFSSKFHADKGWYDLRVEPYGPIALEPTAGVFHYGQALFEGMKAFRQPDGGVKLFRPDFNCSRLNDGARRLCLPEVPREVFMASLRELISLDERWVPAEKGCSLYIRPTLIATEALLKAVPSKEALFFVVLSPSGPYFQGRKTPLRIFVEEKALRAAPGGIGGVKAGGNYASSFQSAIKANKAGFDQVLWLDAEHEGVEEVGTMNVFFVLKGEIVTPALNGSILPGNTRDSVLQILRHKGLPVSERRITMSELLKAHSEGRLLEAFGTGTAAVINSIGELNFRGTPLYINGGELGGLTKQLYDTITGIQYGTADDTFGWMKAIPSLR